MSTTTELELVAPVETRLVAFAGKTGLEPSATTPLVDAFRPIFAEARAALKAAAGVAESVKDATCVSEIRQARACRLAIRRIRIDGEKVKKEQKAAALNYGRAVDGFYNILLADIDPVEKALQDAEDTAERAEVARKDALEAGRKAALAPFVADVSLYAVRDMVEPAFAALMAGCKLAKEQAEAAAAKVEADRIAKEKAEAAERERIRAENERLKQEAIAREAAAKAEREAAEKKLASERAEATRIAAEVKAKADAELKAAAAAAAIERAKIEAKAKAEREEVEAAARKEKLRLQALAEVERQKLAAAQAEAKKLRDAAESKAKAEAEAARKAAAAPDKEKLQALRTAILDLELPEMATQAGKDAVIDAGSRLRALAEFVQLQAAKL